MYSVNTITLIIPLFNNRSVVAITRKYVTLARVVASLDIPTTVARVERHPIPLPATKGPKSHRTQFQRRLKNLRRQHHPQHHSWSHLKQIRPLQVVQRRLLPRRLLSQPLTVNPGNKVSFQVEGSSTTRGCVKGCC